jgi:predicted nucleotidyltransferase
MRLLRQNLPASLARYAFLERLAADPCVEELWLFGSRARGTNAERADIDLAVRCPGATVRDWDRLMGIVDDADTLNRVDLVRLDTLDTDSSLRAAVARDGVLLARREVADA